MINIKMEVKNLAWNENLSKRCNHPLLPKGIRGLIIGKSGCGKTTLQINLLLRPGWLDYNNINNFVKSLFQQEYHILKKAFEEKLPKEVIIRLFENHNEITDLGIYPISIVEEMAKEIRNKSDVVCNFYQSDEDVPAPRELSSEKKNLMLFDDRLLEKQITVNRIMSEKETATLIVSISSKLFQAFTPNNNTNFLCLFTQDLKNLNHIFDDHVGSDMTKEEFRQLLKTASEKLHGFVFIDLSSKEHN